MSKRRHRRAQRLFCVVPSRTHAQRQDPHCIYGGAGGAAERLAGFLCAGIPTPASVTAPYECRNSGGDSLNLQKEAARMATTPTPLHPEFTFHFLAVRRSDLNDRPHRESVNAPDETTARRMLARDFVLLFAGRVPAQG